eukprot:CAMPEP_0184662162 /NCGR_PEP_ID=MMETSP0308-20130426/41913_1 /TAXON_ID=38269 /ORGANISM="Gloeochaete witrockiana, Strain SAG 46.84" /LENGTH=379 /DNA_ID=CAMNT_0027103971 /DNA_START=9 /DNA_END=1148 /DNA_ORIENTATION=+
MALRGAVSVLRRLNVAAHIQQVQRAPASTPNRVISTLVDKRRQAVQKPGDARERHVTVIPGDGVGEEIFDSISSIFKAACVPVKWDVYEIPPNATELPPQIIESLRKNGVGIKGVILTPIKDGHRSLNVMLRKQLDLFAHIIHVHTLPGIPTRHGDLDFVVIRENTEGEYSGMEHEVQPGVVESLKVITRTASLRIADYAFEYAFLNNRKKVTAVHKANIMKLCDGEFLKACREIAKKYPSIEYEEMIVDNTCMQLVAYPQKFDVMVMPNLYGNVVGNIGAGLVGSPAICPGGNVGANVAVFEQGARHAAADIANKNIANPTGELLAAVMMLRYINLPSFADRIQGAVEMVLSEGKVRTLDVGGTASTTDFTKAIIAHL